MTCFRIEIHISGPASTLDEIERETGLRRAPFHSDFRLERVVPFPFDELASKSDRAALAVRIRDEVLEPFRRVMAEEQFTEDRRRSLELDLACVVIRSCEGVSRLRGIPDREAATTWRLQNWGCDSDVASGPPQRPLSFEEDPERIHVSLAFYDEVTTPPLIAFDAIARRWPAAEITAVWDGSEKDYAPCGCGIASWRDGMREGSAACLDRDQSERFGRLHSLAPLRIAAAIRDAEIPATECRPSVRVDLTSAELKALSDGESIELDLGPDHSVSVGMGELDDFNIIGYRLNGYDYCDGRGIGYDEVWRRIPGRVAGMNLALTLHSADAVDTNRAETILTQGSDPILEWVRECRVI